MNGELKTAPNSYIGTMEPGKKKITGINISPTDNGCTVCVDFCMKEEGKEYETYGNHRVNMSKKVWDQLLDIAMEKMDPENKPNTEFYMDEERAKKFR